MGSIRINGGLVGETVDYAGEVPGDGVLVDRSGIYLECDGRAVSRAAWPLLFAAIGTLWGAGDGSTTFNLPDFRGRTAIGAGTGTAGGATAHALASKGGDERLHGHTHTVPKHGHDNNISYSVNSSGAVTNGITGGSHQHKVGYQQNCDAGSNRWGVSDNLSTSATMTVSSTHTHNLPNHTHSLTKSGGVTDKAAFSTESTGGGSSGNMQPYAAVRKLIRAA